jgi:hypothetical protein
VPDFNFSTKIGVANFTAQILVKFKYQARFLKKCIKRELEIFYLPWSSLYFF